MAGLYVHIPFCRSKCAYCDFYSLALTSYADAYVEAVVREFSMRRAEVGGISTIYLGGGTPSVLTEGQIGRLVASLPISDDITEFTIEVNPDDVTPEKARLWRSLGIDRVSMGIQSLDDSELSLIRRRHTAAHAVEAYDTLRRVGFDNISLDLIYGLPGQSLESWRRSLSKVLEMRPEHLSAYILSYEDRTLLGRMLADGRVKAADDGLVEDMYNHLIRAAADAGYEHYEISNFALPGRRAAHNSSYWDLTPYLGLGPAAHSFDGKVRRVNPSDIKAYLAAIGDGRPAFEIDEESDDNRFNDMLFTALRTADGLDFARVPRRRRLRLMCDAFDHLRAGRIVSNNARWHIPEPQWLVSDSIISSLMQV